MAYYEQGKNRKWSVRFRFIEFGKESNKRLSGYTTKKEAEKAYREFLENNISSSKSDYHNITFGEVYIQYNKYIHTMLKESSIYDIEHNYNNHIKQYFAHLKLFKITKHDILAWQNKISTYNYSYNFKSKLRNILSGIFRYSIQYYDLNVNPVSLVTPFRKIEATKEMPIWSLDDFKNFIAVIENDLVYKTLFSLLYFTGCRKGEAFALLWKDIDFNSKTISINKNITRKALNNKPFAVVTTKTGLNRTILISDNLIQLLQELYKSYENITPNSYVFGGNYPLAENTVNRRFYHYIKLSEVPKIHIHCLRHSHASLLIENGENIVAIAKRLGHTSIEQTLNTYSHLMPNTENKMVDKLNISI